MVANLNLAMFLAAAAAAASLSVLIFPLSVWTSLHHEAAMQCSLCTPVRPRGRTRYTVHSSSVDVNGAGMPCSHVMQRPGAAHAGFRVVTAKAAIGRQILFHGYGEALLVFTINTARPARLARPDGTFLLTKQHLEC